MEVLAPNKLVDVGDGVTCSALVHNQLRTISNVAEPRNNFGKVILAFGQQSLVVDVFWDNPRRCTTKSHIRMSSRLGHRPLGLGPFLVNQEHLGDTKCLAEHH